MRRIFKDGSLVGTVPDSDIDEIFEAMDKVWPGQIEVDRKLPVVNLNKEDRDERR